MVGSLILSTCSEVLKGPKSGSADVVYDDRVDLDEKQVFNSKNYFIKNHFFTSHKVRLPIIMFQHVPYMVETREKIHGLLV